MLETAPEAAWGVLGLFLEHQVVTCTRGAQKPT